MEVIETPAHLLSDAQLVAELRRVRDNDCKGFDVVGGVKRFRKAREKACVQELYSRQKGGAR